MVMAQLKLVVDISIASGSESGEKGCVCFVMLCKFDIGNMCKIDSYIYFNADNKIDL